MSRWVYIDGVITVYAPGRTQPEKRYIIDTVLSHLPKVSGSERDMAVDVLQCQDYDSWCSHDEFMIPKKDGVRIQNMYKIVVYGSLRDRSFKESLRELSKFLNRLAKRLSVEDILVRIRQYDRIYVFDNCKPFEKMWEHSKDKNSGELAWWEYLMWDRGNESWMPLQLVSKYYNDEENDAEYDRRKKWLEDH